MSKSQRWQHPGGKLRELGAETLTDTELISILIAPGIPGKPAEDAFSLMCLGHNVKKLVKRVLDGTVRLSRKYNKLIEETVLGYTEEQLTLVGPAA